MLPLLVELAWACGGSPEMGLCVAAEKGPFVIKYYVLKAPSNSASLSTGAEKGTETETKVEQGMKIVGRR